MSDDGWYDIWEDWAFEDDDRFWLSYSRAMLSILLILLLVAMIVFCVSTLVTMAGTWMLFPISAVIVVSWLRWTLTGGKKA